MRSPTLLFFRTFFSFCKLAKLRSVIVIVSAFILDRVVEVAALVIMRRIFLVALYSLEIGQVKVLDIYWFLCPVMELAESVKITIIGWIWTGALDFSLF